MSETTPQSEPQDERFFHILLWAALSFGMPLGIMLMLSMPPEAEGALLLWPQMGIAYVISYITIPVLLLGFVFLIYPNDRPLFQHIEIPFICFWIVAAPAIIMWMIPRVVIFTAVTTRFDYAATSLAVIALGFWLWLLSIGSNLRNDQAPPSQTPPTRRRQAN